MLGHAIEVRLKTSSTGEYEWTASVNTASASPRFTLNTNIPLGLTPQLSSFAYDGFGNMTQEIVTGPGDLRQSTRHTYENRTECDPKHKDELCWLIGLRRRTETRAYTQPPPGTKSKLPASHVVRIVRTEYDEHGLPSNVRVSAWDGKPCFSVEDSPEPWEPCEQKGPRTEFARNTRGMLLSATVTAPDDPNPRVTRYSYDKEGVYGATMTDAAGHRVTTLRHPALGVPVLATDAVQVTTKFKYDGFGRLRETSRPGSATAQRTYSEFFGGFRRGLIVSDTSADGSQSSVTVDELGRPVRQAVLGPDGVWLTMRREYDAAGLLEKVSRPGEGAPAAAETARKYDRLGRVISEAAPGGGLTTHTHHRFYTETQDAMGHRSYARFDAAHRVMHTLHYVDNQEYGKTSFTYGDFDQTVRITDANGNATTLGYDPLGRRMSLATPDSGTTQFQYNGFGELVQATRADGSARTWHHDVLGRVTYQTGSDGETTFVWDQGPHAAGRLVSSTGPETATHYEYDTLGRMRRLTRTAHQDSYEIAQDYDSYGRVKHLFYPGVKNRPRFTIEYVYQASGYLRAINDASSCGIDPNAAGPGDIPQEVIEVIAGGEVQMGKPDAKPTKTCIPKNLWRVVTRSNDLAVEESVLGKGFHVTHSHEPESGRIYQIEAPFAGDSVFYGYDDDGNLKSRTDAYSGRTEMFTYDPLHRLTGWTSTDASKAKFENLLSDLGITYTYDQVGNLTTMSDQGGPEFIAFFGAQGKPHAVGWSSVGGAYSYDDLGRQTAGGGRTITYSQSDLPRQIVTPGAATAFEYDELGGRAAKVRTGRGSQSWTVYVGGLYERRSDESGESHVFYVRGDSGVVAQVMYAGPQETTRYFVRDPLGSPRLVLDEDGKVVEKAFYDPFGGRVDEAGKPVSLDSDPATTVGYTGHEQDEDGLTNMRGRIYDRRQYRFLTPDPLVASPLFGQSYNPYSYVWNNPLRYTDPTGYQEAEHEQQPDPDPPPVTYYDLYELTCTSNTGLVCGGRPEPTKTRISADSSSGTPESSLPKPPEPEPVSEPSKHVTVRNQGTRADKETTPTLKDVAAVWRSQVLRGVSVFNGAAAAEYPKVDSFQFIGAATSVLQGVTTSTSAPKGDPVTDALTKVLGIVQFTGGIIRFSGADLGNRELMEIGGYYTKSAGGMVTMVFAAQALDRNSGDLPRAVGDFAAYAYGFYQFAGAAASSAGPAAAGVSAAAAELAPLAGAFTVGYKVTELLLNQGIDAGHGAILFGGERRF
jgi:RHS repeat-associated protein